MAAEDAGSEEARKASGAKPEEPSPVRQEVRRSMFSSGLVKMLMGLAAAVAVGTPATIWYQRQVEAGTPPQVIATPMPVPYMTMGDIIAVPLSQPQQGSANGFSGPSDGAAGTDENQE